MFAVIGRVRIKPGQEDLSQKILSDHGVAMFEGMTGAQHAYWSRPVDRAEELIQHSLWLFDTEKNARAAAQTFNSLRDNNDAPVAFVSCDVCEVVGEGSPT